MKAKIDNLISDLNGKVIIEGMEAYNDLRKVWNGMIDAHPELLVLCETKDDVVKAVNFARENGIAVSIRGGGHNVAGRAVVDGGMVIDLRNMRDVKVDPEKRTAFVEGGATLGDIDGATQSYGKVVPSGFVSRTGIAGLALGGGLGHLTRRFGFTCDNILSVEIVTGNGEILEVNEKNHGDFFWAIRGGGIDLGVVTTFRFRLHDIGPEVIFIMQCFPEEESEKVFQFQKEYMKEAPNELGLISFFATLPHDEAYPEEARGRRAVVFYGIHSGETREGEQIADTLRSSAALLADLGGRMPYAEAQKKLDEDYPDGMRYYWKSIFINDLSEEVIGVLQESGTQRPSDLSTLDVWTLGGKSHSLDKNENAFSNRDAEYMIAIEGNWTDSRRDSENINWVRKTIEALEPLTGSQGYINFAGNLYEYKESLQNKWERFQRLRRCKDKYDPHRVFQPM